MLYLTNTKESWRNLVGTRIPDIHMKDVEILLRGFAMLIDGATYTPSMVRFLNSFSQNAKSYNKNKLEQLQKLLDSFLDSCQNLPPNSFHSTKGRFSPMIFESVFVAACQKAYHAGQVVKGKIELDSLNYLKENSEFRSATQSQTTSQSNVKKRIERAQENTGTSLTTMVEPRIGQEQPNRGVAERPSGHGGLFCSPMVRYFYSLEHKMHSARHWLSRLQVTLRSN